LRTVVVGALAVAIAVAIGAVIYIGPWEARETDETYVSLAVSTPQGKAYFSRFPGARCNVFRGRRVTVNCDTILVDGAARYAELFRVYIDARTNAVDSVEIRTSAP
jgi:hypothetical protein